MACWHPPQSYSVCTKENVNSRVYCMCPCDTRWTTFLWRWKLYLGCITIACRWAECFSTQLPEQAIDMVDVREKAMREPFTPVLYFTRLLGGSEASHELGNHGNPAHSLMVYCYLYWLACWALWWTLCQRPTWTIPDAIPTDIRLNWKGFIEWSSQSPQPPPGISKVVQPRYMFANAERTRS